MKNSSAKVVWEESILIYAFVKWLLLASVAGAMVGGASCFFVKSLDWAIAEGRAIPGFFRLIMLPLGIVASTLIVKYMAPDARGHGTEKVIEAIHERSGRISVKVIPVKLVTTIITIASGGSAGKEGPAAQIGAGLTSTLATILRFSDIDRKKLVVCGISAGFAAVFGTPMAGALFGLEVLYIGQIFYDVLFPSIISGIVSYQVAIYFGMSYGGFAFVDIPQLSPTMSAWLLLAGVFFGVISFVHIELMAFFDRLFSRSNLGLVGKALLGASLLLGLGSIIGDSYYGLGLDTLDLALKGSVVPSLAFLWKSLLTAITLSCGGSGGVVTPIFFIGATSGVTFASLFGLNGALFGPLGFAGVLAGCANAPISATVMAMELFGGQIGVMAAIVSVSAFFVVGHRSVYPSQRLARSKSPMIAVGRRPCRVDQGRSVPLVNQSVFFSAMVGFWRYMESRFNLRAPERFRRKRL